ncbi:MAG: hypothetical protein AAF702_29755 [Chloroflexota bacterium]
MNSYKSRDSQVSEQFEEVSKDNESEDKDPLQIVLSHLNESDRLEKRQEMNRLILLALSLIVIIIALAATDQVELLSDLLSQLNPLLQP